jgi:hypothetical protein
MRLTSVAVVVAQEKSSVLWRALLVPHWKPRASAAMSRFWCSAMGGVG